MAVEIIVGFDWAHDIGVYGRARAAVPSLVTIAIGSGRQEDYLWSLVTTIIVIVGLKSSRAHASVGWRL
jgi:hypothetical protein